jgi:HPt (histidine-containing phosphotransfer) domain-containing protein
LEQAIAAGDFQQASQHGHAIKGAAAGIGGQRLRQVARWMEQAGKEDDAPRCTALLPLLQTAFEELKGALPHHG